MSSCVFFTYSDQHVRISLLSKGSGGTVTLQIPMFIRRSICLAAMGIYQFGTNFLSDALV